MALLSSLFKKPRRLTINVPLTGGRERQILILDATTNISHENDANPTEHPVEDGSIISDNIDLMPKSISFQAVMSEAPITIEQALIGNAAGAIPAIGGFGGTPVGTIFTGAVSTLGGLLLNRQGARVEDAMNTMLELQEKGIPVTIITGLRAYNNMILIRFNPIETPDVGQSLSFSATFMEIKIVQSESVVLPGRVLDPDVENSANSSQNLGKKNTLAAEGRGSSVLSRITGIGA